MEKRITPGVLADAAMAGEVVCDLDTGKEGAEQKAGKIGGRVVDLVDASAVAELVDKSERFGLLFERWNRADLDNAGVPVEGEVQLSEVIEAMYEMRAALVRFGGAK